VSKGASSEDDVSALVSFGVDPTSSDEINKGVAIYT